MQVQILETSMIHPSSPPPVSDDHPFPLSHLDNDPTLHVTFRYLRVYVNAADAAASHLNHPFRVISTALSSALNSYYHLTGTLRRRQMDNRLELYCDEGQGVPLVNATVDCTLESVKYLDDPESCFVEQFAPDPTREEALVKPCVLQVTVFKCGGFTLGAAINHALCDGLGATQFFSAVAEVARGADRISVEPVWDRACLLGPREEPRVVAPIREFLSLDKEFEPYGQAVGPVVSESFNVKEEWLNQFKGWLRNNSGLSFTTFEALGAFIWQAKVKASKTPGDEKVKFAYSINIRKLVNPPLPTGYWGNGCIAMYVQLTAGELTERPIWKTAELIKLSKKNATDEYVRSFLDFQELHYGDGITAGKGVSGFTDWRHLGHSSVDFGWGGPVTVLPLSKNLLGSVEPCYFLPYSSAIVDKKDGFKVLVTLRGGAMPAFREEMARFSRNEF